MWTSALAEVAIHWRCVPQARWPEQPGACRQLNLQKQRLHLSNHGLCWHWLSHTFIRDRLRWGKGCCWGSPIAVTFHVTFPLKGKSPGKQSNLQIPGVGGLDSGTGGDVNTF